MTVALEQDLSIPAIKIPHLGVESYFNMWQKVRSIWKYIYTHYVNDFDWFLLGGDDMYYLVDNLKHYLGSEKVQLERKKGNGNVLDDRIRNTYTFSIGVYLGRTYNFTIDKYIVPYNTGGAGYLLDSVAVSKLVSNINLPFCHPGHEVSSEDMYVAICLKNIANPIFPFDSRYCKN